MPSTGGVCTHTHRHPTTACSDCSCLLLTNQAFMPCWKFPSVKSEPLSEHSASPHLNVCQQSRKSLKNVQKRDEKKEDISRDSWGKNGFLSALFVLLGDTWSHLMPFGIGRWGQAAPQLGDPQSRAGADASEHSQITGVTSAGS